MSGANAHAAHSLPTLLGVLPDGIPAALKEHKQRWALWRAIWILKKGKYDKVPCRPGSLHGASTAKGTWWSFDAALSAHACPVPKTDGVGFKLTDISGLVGIDLDKCVEGGTLAPWAREVVDQMQSYAEFSPSGNGVRIFVAADIASDWTNHAQGVEVYGGHAARFLTVTGRHIAGTPNDVQPAPEGALAWLENEHRKKATPDGGSAAHAVDMPELLAENTLPNLDELEDRGLSARARDFLEGGDFEDRSKALAITTRTLYEATATETGELRDDIVLSLLANNAHAWAVAREHRPRSDEASADAAALDYLWEHHCKKARAKASPMVLDFDDIDDATGGAHLGTVDDAANGANDQAAPTVADSVKPADGTTPPAACDGKKPKPGALEYVDFTTLAHGSPPARKWTVDKWLAAGTVTVLYGPAGVGKSLLAEQLAIAVANGDPWLGLPTIRGPVIGLFCEDDENELKWRAKFIFEAGCHDPVEASRGLHLDARAGKPNALLEFSSDRRTQPSVLMNRLQAQCKVIRPALVILDNIAQMFTGSEIDRVQVTGFCNLLTGLAQSYDCSVLLLGHPAKATDSEYSGSTAWEAAVRARLLLRREEDGTLRLSKAKANYAELAEIALQYVKPRGPFALLAAGANPDPEALEEAKDVLLAAVVTYTRRQQATSHLATARNHLLKLMKADGLLGDTSDQLVAKALSALLDSGQLVPNAELAWKTASRHTARGLAPGVTSPGGAENV